MALPVVLGIAGRDSGRQQQIFSFSCSPWSWRFFIPDFWLNHAVKKRRERIRLSLPDGLDLLAICMEAGLGLDQGIVRVGQELRVSHPD